MVNRACGGVTGKSGAEDTMVCRCEGVSGHFPAAEGFRCRREEPDNPAMWGPGPRPLWVRRCASPCPAVGAG